LALISLAACGSERDAPPPPPPPAVEAPPAPACPPDGEGVSVLEDRLTIDGPLSFDLYAGTITEESHLDAIARRLLACEDINLEIQVHTDSMRARAFNAQRSQVIAEALRARLLERGVAPERVVACGYGEDHPIAPNHTAAGRAANMREIGRAHV